MIARYVIRPVVACVALPFVLLGRLVCAIPESVLASLEGVLGGIDDAIRWTDRTKN